MSNACDPARIAELQALFGPEWWPAACPTGPAMSIVSTPIISPTLLPGGGVMPFGNFPFGLGGSYTTPQIPSVIPPIVGGAAAGVAGAITQEMICAVFPSLCGSGAGTFPSAVPQAGPYSLGVQVYPCPPGRKLKADGTCAKRRSMNMLNPHALKRAARRLAGFNSFAQKTEKELSKIVRSKTRVRSGRSGCGTCGKAKCSCR